MLIPEILKLKPQGNFKNFCLEDNYLFENDGRHKLCENNGLSLKVILRYLRSVTRVK